MDRILIAPDSFKGSLPAATFCRIVAGAAARVEPALETIALPVADGGEGTVDALLAALGGERVEQVVIGPEFAPVGSFFGVLPDGRAVLETAAAAGPGLLAGRPDPLRTTTFGVGQLIAAALDRGCREILLGLGGSATTDGGAGAAAALGARLLDSRGAEIPPTGEGLGRLAALDLSRLDPRLAGCRLLGLGDVHNPLCGPEGAAQVFGPQKGAGPEEVLLLDRNLRRLAEVLARTLGREVARFPGAGAAGGLGAGLAGLLGGVLVPGAEAVLDGVGFDRALEGAALVITGEGRLNRQSLSGKAPVAVARRSTRAGVPVLALVGGVDDAAIDVRAAGFTSVLAIQRRPLGLEEALARAEEALDATAEEALRLFLAGRRRCGA